MAETSDQLYVGSITWKLYYLSVQLLFPSSVPSNMDMFLQVLSTSKLVLACTANVLLVLNKTLNIQNSE